MLIFKQSMIILNIKYSLPDIIIINFLMRTNLIKFTFAQVKPLKISAVSIQDGL